MSTAFIITALLLLGICGPSVFGLYMAARNAPDEVDLDVVYLTPEQWDWWGDTVETIHALPATEWDEVVR